MYHQYIWSSFISANRMDGGGWFSCVIVYQCMMGIAGLQTPKHLVQVH